MRRIFVMVAAVFIMAAGAVAQEGRSEISLQGTGVFTKDSTGQGNTQRATQTGGFLVGYRYHFNRWLAAEAAYGYNRNSQHFLVPGEFSRSGQRAPGHRRVRRESAGFRQIPLQPLRSGRRWGAGV